MDILQFLQEFVTTSGLAVALVICGVFAMYKGFPKLLDAYKEANENIVNAIKELATAFEVRLAALESKVDNVEDKVTIIEQKIDKE